MGDKKTDSFKNSRLTINTIETEKESAAAQITCENQNILNTLVRFYSRETFKTLKLFRHILLPVFQRWFVCTYIQHSCFDIFRH